MKKLLWTGLMLLAFVWCYSSCGRVTEQEVSETNKPVATATPLATTTASGTAVTATPVPVDEAYDFADKMVANMTLEEKIGQMFLVDLYQLDKSHTKTGMIQRVSKKMRKTLRRYNVGGVYLMEGNFSSKKQTQKLMKKLQGSVVTGGSLYVAVEEDGGGEHSISAKVAQLKDTGYITPQEMGQNMTGEQIYESGKTIGLELSEIGVNLNLAPVADIGSEYNTEYAKRCLGTETQTVADNLKQYVKGMREGGVAVTLKYFPGIGKISGDCSEEIQENIDSLMTLRNNNFLVYEKGIEAGADCIMMGNVSLPEILTDKTPAFMSEDIVTKLLRKELKFDGVVMTAPLNDNVIRDNYSTQEVVLEAVKAGCDMLVLPLDFQESYEALLDAVKNGVIEEKRIDESVCRILQNKIQRGIITIDNNE